MSMEDKIAQAKGAVEEGVGKLTGDKKVEKDLKKLDKKVLKLILD